MCLLFSAESISPSLMVFPRPNGKIQTVREACTVLQVEVIIFSCCIRGLLLIEKKLEEVDFVDEEFLHTKINKNGVYMWIMVAIKDIPEDACSLGSLSQTL